MKSLKNKKGFTLVELVVVMVILGILAVILIPKISGVQDGAKKSACKANLRTLESMTAVWVSELPGTRIPGGASVADLEGLNLISTNQAVCPGGTSGIGIYSNSGGTWSCSVHTTTPAP